MLVARGVDHVHGLVPTVVKDEPVTIVLVGRQNSPLLDDSAVVLQSMIASVCRFPKSRPGRFRNWNDGDVHGGVRVFASDFPKSHQMHVIVRVIHATIFEKVPTVIVIMVMVVITVIVIMVVITVVMVVITVVMVVLSCDNGDPKPEKEQFWQHRLIVWGSSREENV
jgi:hypothetical protein